MYRYPQPGMNYISVSTRWWKIRSQTQDGKRFDVNRSADWLSSEPSSQVRWQKQPLQRTRPARVAFLLARNYQSLPHNEVGASQVIRLTQLNHGTARVNVRHGTLRNGPEAVPARTVTTDCAGDSGTPREASAQPGEQ